MKQIVVDKFDTVMTVDELDKKIASNKRAVVACIDTDNNINVLVRHANTSKSYQLGIFGQGFTRHNFRGPYASLKEVILAIHIHGSYFKSGPFYFETEHEFFRWAARKTA